MKFSKFEILFYVIILSILALLLYFDYSKQDVVVCEYEDNIIIDYAGNDPNGYKGTEIGELIDFKGQTNEFYYNESTSKYFDVYYAYLKTPSTINNKYALVLVKFKSDYELSEGQYVRVYVIDKCEDIVVKSVSDINDLNLYIFNVVSVKNTFNKYDFKIGIDVFNNPEYNGKPLYSKEKQIKINLVHE